MAFIYGLFDPREPLLLWEVRYIGQTTIEPSVRLIKHISQAKSGRTECYRDRWVRKLLREGVDPIIRVLERVEDSNRFEREKAWIASGRYQGWRLTNATDGGEGNNGLKVSPETREKQRQAKLGRRQSEEHRRNTGKAAKRSWEDPAIRQQHSDSLKTFYNENPEERQAISDRNKAWWEAHPEARLEKSQKEKAYNQEHPEMVVRRNESIRAAKAKQDKSPHMCEQCDAGPFIGAIGLDIHMRQAHNEDAIEPHMCECGAGPFVGERGLNIHRKKAH